MEYSDKNETAVCTLATLALPAFWDAETKTFDWERYMVVAAMAVRLLNNVIDFSYYPVESTKVSNLRHRPLGIGIQGLADLFMLHDMCWDDPEASDLNEKVAAFLYYATVSESCLLAEHQGAYPAFHGSPASDGHLQYALWGKAGYQHELLDWGLLEKRVQSHGLRNTHLTSYPPTASTAALLGNTEMFEPIPMNIYGRNLLSGSFRIINKHLVRDLEAMGLWTEAVVQDIIAAKGSISEVIGIPARLKKKYRTVWEISQRTLIELAAGRGPYVDQSQPLNAYFAAPTFSKVSTFWFIAWKMGLKTGMYYLRQKKAVESLPFTIKRSAYVSAADERRKMTSSAGAGASLPHDVQTDNDMAVGDDGGEVEGELENWCALNSESCEGCQG